MAERQSVAVFQQFRTLYGAGTAVGLDDGQLLERFVDRRDEAAFAALLARHGPLVLGACRRLLANPADVEDAFQATFLVLVRKARSLRNRRLLGTWLYKVAYRVALRARAQADRRTQAVHEPEAMAPAEDVERRELREVIDEEILRLPRRFRGPVVLCYLEGVSHEEAARRLGCPLGTVNSRLATARQRLRTRLSKRGLAPAGALIGTTSLSSVATAAVPAPLLRVTSSAALRAANGSAAAGTAGATAVVLAEGFFRAMITSKFRLAVAGVFAAGLTVVGLGLLPRGATGEQQSTVDATASASVPARKEPQSAVKSDAADRAEPVTVPVAGVIRMPDGSPAAGANVEVITASEEPTIIARANDAGRFQLSGVLGNGAALLASSADGRHQTTMAVSSAAVRTAFTSPIELLLAPALTHEVIVLSNGRPVEGAHVAGGGQRFRVHGVTGRDGKAKLWLPATERIGRLVAWHRDLGVNSARVGDLETHAPHETTQLALLPPSPHTIRVVDVDGTAISGLELSLAVRTVNSDWIDPSAVAEAHVRTNAAGTATVPWAPRDALKYVDVEIVGSGWNIDQTDLQRVGEGMTTVHARRKRPVEGRLVMPSGGNAFGILITGFGSGPKNRGDIPYVRARRDGTFTLPACSDYTYVLGIDDTQWASEPWSGVVIGKDRPTQPEIAISVYPATPLTMRVTRGPRRDPVVNAWLVLSSSNGNFIRRRLWTDARGVARAGVGKGPHTVTLRLDPWTEERTIQVASDKPVELEFHRPWNGERHVTGRLLEDGAHYTPSPGLVAHAWTPQGGRPPLEFQPKVRPDGTFNVAFDAENLSLLFVDPSRQRSGFGQVGQAGSTVELTMMPTATYSGTLLDEKAQPLPGRTLQLDVQMARHDAVPACQSDGAGRFRFEGVPARVPLRLLIGNEGDGPEYDLGLSGDRLFEPGEVRENDKVRARRLGPAASAGPPSVPLAQRIDNLCRDARLNGMRPLVLLQGDDSPNVVTATSRLLDPNRARSVSKYLTLRVEAARLKTEAPTLASLGCALPGMGEIVLVALNGDRKTIADKRVSTAEMAAAITTGDDFLKRQVLPARNAKLLLEKARDEAKGSRRRVWIVYGGPRCAPCFQLARWIDDHHTTLEKDFVIVKIMDDIDEHVGEVIAEVPWKRQDGVPWFAITEPDGTVMATSESPLGNMGFPSSVEEIRHFRRMLDRTVRRLKPDEVDGLVNSLAR